MRRAAEKYQTVVCNLLGCTTVAGGHVQVTVAYAGRGLYCSGVAVVLLGYARDRHTGIVKIQLLQYVASLACAWMCRAADNI